MIILPKELEELLKKEAFEEGIDVEVLIIDKLSQDLDPETRTSLYLDMSEELYKKALEEFEKGDLIQSSEKAWGSCTAIVKAYAEEKGLKHYYHVQLEEVVEKIFEETKSEEILNGWAVCNRLRANEDFMSKDSLKVSLEIVGKFISEVKKLVKTL